MSENKIASVIIPVYGDDFLIETIDSVLCQDYDPIEIVVINDKPGLFDAERFSKYIKLNKEKNIINYLVLSNDTNLGTVKSLNKAISKCKGEIIFTIGGDDTFYDETVIRKCMERFMDEELMILTGKRFDYDAQLKKPIRCAPSKEEIKIIKKEDCKSLFQSIAAENYIFGCCTVRRRNVIDRFGLFDERYRFIEDHPSNLKLLRNGVPIKYIDLVIIKHRSGGVSSAENIDSGYFSEADLIFQNEVIPYVQSPKVYEKKYSNWKNRTILERKYRLSKEKNKNRPLLKVFDYVVFRLDKLKYLG